jgi:hypothetical protein
MSWFLLGCAGLRQRGGDNASGRGGRALLSRSNMFLSVAAVGLAFAEELATSLLLLSSLYAMIHLCKGLLSIATIVVEIC